MSKPKPWLSPDEQVQQLNVVSAHVEVGGERPAVLVGGQVCHRVAVRRCVGLGVVHAVHGALERVAGVADRDVRVGGHLQKLDLAHGGPRDVADALAGERRGGRGVVVAVGVDDDVVAAAVPRAVEAVDAVHGRRVAVVEAVAGLHLPVGHPDREDVVVVVGGPGVQALHDLAVPAHGAGHACVRLLGRGRGEREAGGDCEHRCEDGLCRP